MEQNAFFAQRKNQSSAKWNQLKDLESVTLTQSTYGEFSILMSYPEAPEVEEEM